MTKFVLTLMLLFSLTEVSQVRAETADNSDAKPYIDNDVIVDPVSGRRTNLYHYGYTERTHSVQETVTNVGVVYGLTWVFYPLIQPKVFKVHDGVNQYKNNFGKLVFDKDEPVWNFFVHPISGSQLFLLYRAQGYSRMSALGLTTISSTLFELTVEILTEPASVQDLYMTPILGTVLGLGIESFSMSLLNSGTTAGKIVGHLINPATLLPLYEGRTLIIPKFEPEDKGAMVKVELMF
ncbi:DUF3943 domain-containing protein [Bacteriovorax sp. PP10]|uniref:DUF3943 domain-containing protein n=1 Tax=Bacteriovorax antarcticus TaxID=3088717 RepID=A0ABU5VXV1_9BACT|nr:DUF3943 domain-containing protein [Bacteriovorax sp. PP10]MEA9357895.1 DUF3943 domain-containing protein [Bacteriovorax sp. PP10]